MKRIIITILTVTVFCILFTLSAMADVNVDYNSDTLTLSVSGSFEDSVGKAVTLQILNPGKTESDVLSASLSDLKTVIYNIKETRCDSEGNFSFDPFKINGESGYYGVRVCVKGQTPVYLEKGFLYVSPEFEAEIISVFNDENTEDAELADLLCSGSGFLKLDDFAAFDEAERVEIVTLLKREAQNIKEVTARVNSAVAVYKIKGSDTASKVNAVIEEYSDFIEKECSVFGIYKDSDSDAKEAVAERVFENKKFDSVEDFVKFFGDNAIFEAIYAMDNYIQLEDVLKNSEEWLDADFSSYYNCKNKKKAALEIIGNRYDDADDLEAAVKKAVKNAQDTSESKDKGSSGSGGGGGGGSVIAVPQTQTSVNESPVETKPVPDTKPAFSDMEDAQWALEAVEFLNSAGIVNGVSATEFAPNSFVTREQFAKMVITAFGSADMQKTSKFADCPTEHWSSPYVAAAYDAGIVNGISDTEFGMGMNISRQDMAVMLYRAAKNAGVAFDDGETVSFADEADIASYAKEAVISMAKYGIISGMGDGIFAPSANATRAQAAQMIYGLMTKGGVN